MWRLKRNWIPPITDPLGKYWKQPERFEITIDDTKASMSTRTFDELANYSYSMPSGVYPGKMWKRKHPKDPHWKLCWFSFHEDPKLCSNHYREIVIVE